VAVGFLDEGGTKEVVPHRRGRLAWFPRRVRREEGGRGSKEGGTSISPGEEGRKRGEEERREERRGGRDEGGYTTPKVGLVP
jgi:hypothetical protein